LEHITVHYSERDLYSIPFAIVYDMALRLGLIELMADKVVLKRNQIHSFFAQSNERIHHCLYTIWLMRFLPRQAWMQHAIAVMVPFAPLGQWFCLDQIAEYLKTNEITMDNLEKEEAMIQFKQQWIHPLVALGWLELGKDSQSNEWGRWLISLNISNSSQHLQVNREHEVLVQPNFEIIAPLTLSIEYRWELECFAEHVQTDRVSRYVLTKDSLDRAYKNGRTVGDITGYLQKYGKYGIPENVEVTIAQWGKQFEVEGWRKPPFYPKWAATEHIQPFAWPKEATNKGMLSPRFDSDDYEEVTNLPKIEAMYDKLAEIPPIWLKDHREYHISVRKEIITKAIEWKTYIRIRETGQLKTVIPKEIIPNHGSWNVQCLLDGRKTQLSPDDLKSLLLILPGINDGSE
ncbi:MAG TPA: helicase-associated domain-containing protein, partial [Bacilli bacterium]